MSRIFLILIGVFYFSSIVFAQSLQKEADNAYLEEISQLNIAFPENELMGEGQAAVISDEGSFYYLDNSNYRLYHFDKDGNLLWSVGQEGRGPGDFMEVSSIDVKHGKVYVLDFMNNRIQLFDAGSGVFSGTINLNKNIYHSSKLLLPNRNKIQILGYFSENELFVHEYDMEGNYITSFGQFIDYSQFQTNASSRHQLTQLNASEDPNGNIFYVTGAPYKIFKYNSEAKLTWSFEDEQTLPKPWIEHIVIKPNSYSARPYPVIIQSLAIDHLLMIYWINPIQTNTEPELLLYLDIRSTSTGELFSRSELNSHQKIIALKKSGISENKLFVLTKKNDLSGFNLYALEVNN